MPFTIKVLDSKEFDEVAKSDPRYEFVDENNLGFADREKGLAFVRQTNVHELNKFLINHELEELESDESTHEDPNGIRHKKFFKDVVVPGIIGAAQGFATGGFTGAAVGGNVGAIKGLSNPKSEQRAVPQQTQQPGQNASPLASFAQPQSATPQPSVPKTAFPTPPTPAGPITVTPPSQATASGAGTTGTLSVYPIVISLEKT